MTIDPDGYKGKPRARALDKRACPRENESMPSLPSPGALPSCCALLLAAACAGDAPESGRRAASRAVPPQCAAFPTAAASREATLAYLEGLTPKPLRFLTAAGTDSALPDPAFAALQGKGPSYLYPPANPDALAKLHDRLDRVGPWATLLVAWKGAERLGDSTAVIRLRGHYIIGEGQGTSAPPRAIRFVCSTQGWKVAEVREERAT